MKVETLEKYTLGENLFLSGQSLTSIAKELRLNRGRFTKWLKERGHTITNPSKKYIHNETFFENIDTEEKAYWLGFLYADGYVGEILKDGKLKSYYLSLGLASIDESHLHKFRDSLKSNSPISQKNVKCNGKVFSSHIININSTKMCCDLIKLGCTPRKGNFLKFPSKDIVSDELLPHFVRGYIGGDGSLMLNVKKNGGRLAILGTSDFLNGMVERMGWKPKTIRQAKPTSTYVYHIEYYAKEELKSMLHELYKNASVYLDRKYEKYEEIIALLDRDI